MSSQSNAVNREESCRRVLRHNSVHLDARLVGLIAAGGRSHRSCLPVHQTSNFFIPNKTNQNDSKLRNNRPSPHPRHATLHADVDPSVHWAAPTPPPPKISRCKENCTHDRPKRLPAKAGVRTQSTRPRTAAQIAASRENGSKSKGPTTQAGLNRSKMNAVKHGLCGEFLLLYGESIRAYSELREQFMQRFQPQDGIECNLVESLAETTWEIARAGASKRNSMMIAIDEERPFFDRKFKDAHHTVRIAWAQQEQLKPGHTGDILERHIGRLERSFDRAFKQLVELRKTFPLPDLEPQTQIEPNEPKLAEPPVESTTQDDMQPAEPTPAAQIGPLPIHQPLFGTSLYALNVDHPVEEPNHDSETDEKTVNAPLKVRSAAA